MAGHVLQQTPTREDVDRLKAAADAEHGHRPSLGLAPGDLVEFVAGGVDIGRAGDRLVVEGGIQVRAAGEHQPRHLPEQAVSLHRGRGDGDRDGIAAVAADRVKVQLTLAEGQGRVRGVGGVGDDEDDGRSCGCGSGWHERQHSACVAPGRDSPRRFPVVPRYRRAGRQAR